MRATVESVGYDRKSMQIIVNGRIKIQMTDDQKLSRIVQNRIPPSPPLFPRFSFAHSRLLILRPPIHPS
jgi:hypothetical protein